jgi:hypothetical protein
MQYNEAYGELARWATGDVDVEDFMSVVLACFALLQPDLTAQLGTVIKRYPHAPFASSWSSRPRPRPLSRWTRASRTVAVYLVVVFSLFLALSPCESNVAQVVTSRSSSCFLYVPPFFFLTRLVRRVLVVCFLAGWRLSKHRVCFGTKNNNARTEKSIFLMLAHVFLPRALIVPFYFYLLLSYKLVLCAVLPFVARLSFVALV